MKFSVVLVALAWFASHALPAAAGAGEFDRSFGQNGIALVPTSGGGVARFVTTDRAGRVLATGYAAPVFGGSDRMVRVELIARMLADGSQDPSFNGTGSIISPAMPGNGGAAAFFGHEGRSLLPTADGWLAIRTEEWPCYGPLACSAYHLPKVVGRRISMEGSSDPSYGQALLGFGGDGFDRDHSMQLLPDPDGGVTLISAGPEGFQGIDRNTTVQRILANGQPDANFNSSMAGILGCRMLPDADGRRSSAKALRLPDGKLLLAQGIEINPNAVFRLRVPTPNPYRVCVSRFHADGRVDASYGNNGDLLLDGSAFASSQNTPVALLPMPTGGAVLVLDRKLVLSGSSGSYYSIVWLTAEGSLDTSRGLGQGVIGPTNVLVAVVAAATIQRDGAIVLAGYPESRPQYTNSSQEVDYSQPIVGRLRYESDSPVFGADGRGFTPLVSLGRRLMPYHLHVAGDGSIFVAGAVANGPYVSNELAQFAVGKLQGDPLPVSSGASQGGGGGCGFTRNPRLDPTIPGLALLALLALGARQWRRR